MCCLVKCPSSVDPRGTVHSPTPGRGRHVLQKAIVWRKVFQNLRSPGSHIWYWYTIYQHIRCVYIYVWNALVSPNMGVMSFFIPPCALSLSLLVYMFLFIHVYLYDFIHIHMCMCVCCCWWLQWKGSEQASSSSPSWCTCSRPVSGRSNSTSARWK